MAADKAGTTSRVGRSRKGSMAPLQVAVAKDYAQHHPKPQFAGAPPPRNIQQPRISTTIPPSRQSSFADPNSGGLHSAFQSPHLNSAGQVQHSPYAASHDSNYYASHPSPHSAASASGHYPPAGSDQMAATAHMHRPYPPIYHTPQSNSPASVASPHTHDQHGRNLYGQPAPQLAQPIYGYQQYSPMSQVHASQYAPHSGQQSHHPMPHASMMQPPSSNAPMQQHQQPPPIAQSGGITSSSPRLRMDPMPHQAPHQTHHQQPQQTPQQHQQPQQPQQPPPSVQHPVGRVIHQQTPTQPPSISANSVGLGQTSTSNINPSAAPGPIPATTPLVVRQDGNGVQWIAFEYSRDRIKSEYTIRCDVESVNVDSLSADFKNENCVYPRACCGKDSYKGNRLNYETECNAVGWALAELNICLRGKRGLIQRAVDSWRNSNQDPRLRSRRVRRQAKVQQRNKNAQQGAPLTGPGTVGLAGASGNTSSTSIRAPPSSTVSSMGAGQLHHHHARPDMALPGQPDSSAEADYSPPSAPRPPTTQSQSNPTPTDPRPGRVFTGYPAYPPAASSASPAALPGYTSLDALNRPGGSTSMVAAPSSAVRETATARVELSAESRKRKFEGEEAVRQQDDRVRLGMQFSHDGSHVSPHAYRSYPDFPRSSYLPSVPAPATTGRLRPVTFFDRVPSTSESTRLQRPSFERSADHVAYSSLGEITEEQRRDRGSWPAQEQGRSLPRRANWSPRAVEFRALPPAIRNC